jgi:beta-galactosidase
MELGVCYYPEHWPEETWQPDAARMKALGLSWVRIGEFAWSRLEPRPGVLAFDWLERALNTLGNAGLKVVLGTPTATPPKWLLDRYPDIYPVDAQGRRRGFGSRRHYSFNSPSYRRESERIVTLLAQRFGNHPAVAAWQTDNEYGCHDTVRSYGPHDLREFRAWLKRRYKTVEALNAAWWNAFWSMEVTSFEEIELPNLTVTEANPSHVLDFYRFCSDAVIAFNKLQVEIIRRYSPGRPILHNAMLFFGDFDHYRLAQDLDIVAWDNYPLGMLELSPLPEAVKVHFLRVGHVDLISFHHDLYRGLKRAPFWVMEQQPGQVNWAPCNPLPAPGAVRLWSHQAFAHGAAVVSYFRWRAAHGAQELMHAGLNLHDGSPDRASEEVRTVFAELQAFDVPPPEQAAVALLFDYENLWATHVQRHAAGWDYWALQLSYYAALRSLGLDVDILHPRMDLAGYRLVLAPALHLVDAELAAHLEGYVAAGGRLVLGPRSGAKQPSNIVWAPAPGPLQHLMGVRIDRVDALRPGVSGTVRLGNRTFTYETWADLLTPTTAEVLATYETPAYAGTAAVTRQPFGHGACVTWGMWGGAALHEALLTELLREVGLVPNPLPDGVRITRRGALCYRFNFNPIPVEVAGVVVPPHGVVIRHDQEP